MVESLVVTLREGIEAALVLGIILAYLSKTGREHLRRPVYGGLAIAIAASLVVAWAFQASGFDPENEYLEGALQGIAGLFVASMVIWMWRTARGLRREMESRLSALAGESGARGGAGFGLLLFTFFMVFREGVETVLFLQAVAIGEEADPLGLLGAALGLALAALFAVLFIRGSLAINLSRFFNVTGIVLLALAAKLLAGSAHEFGEVRVIPLNKEIMAVLGYLVRDDTATLLVTALVAVPIFLLLWESLRKRQDVAPLEGENPAERRKRLAALRLERAWQLGLGAATLSIMLGLGATALAGAKMIDPQPEAVAVSSGQVRVPIEALQDGQLHKFVHTLSDGTTVRFLAVRLKDGSFATALDACQICGSVGYGQEGGVAICKNCNAPIAFDTFSFGGGCNPLLLDAEVEGENLVVQAASLEAAAGKFR